MSKPISFQGIYPILATPFREDETIDLESFDRLIRFMAQIGVEGVTILGVLGESNRLLDREREELIKTAVNAAGDMPVIVGTSYSGTFAALALSQMAEALGADGVMVTPQAEPVPNEDRIFEYYRTIAEGIGIPMVLQDHPASTGVHMSVALISRAVAEIPRIACIKEEATPTPPKIRALRQSMKTRSVPVLTGLGALYGEFDLEAGLQWLQHRLRVPGGSAGDGPGEQFRRLCPIARAVHPLPSAHCVRATARRCGTQGNSENAGAHRFEQSPAPRCRPAARRRRATAVAAGACAPGRRHHKAANPLSESAAHLAGDH